MAGSYSRTEHSMQGAFIFVLLGLFALMSTLMVLLGAQMYRATVESTEHNNEGRLLSAYVRSMVRAQDSGAAVEITQENGVHVLRLIENYDGDEYITRLYQYDGNLYEYFTGAENAFAPGDGTVICAANRMYARMDGQLLIVNMTDGRNRPCNVRVALRCVS